MEKVRLLNNTNLIKKIVLYAVVVIYDFISLFWCYIISSNFVYNLAKIQQRGPSITIIGGADLPTWSFLMGGVIGCACSVLFVVLSLITVFLFTVAILKKQKNQKLCVLLCGLSVLTLIVFVLIPANTYIVSLYALVRKLSFLKHLPILYVICSLLAIVANALIAIKKGEKIR